jgi:hypothetical protein
VKARKDDLEQRIKNQGQSSRETETSIAWRESQFQTFRTKQRVIQERGDNSGDEDEDLWDDRTSLLAPEGQLSGTITPAESSVPAESSTPRRRSTLTTSRPLKRQKRSDSDSDLKEALISMANSVVESRRQEDKGDNCELSSRVEKVKASVSVRVLHLLMGQPVEVCALAVLSFLSSQALLLSL